MQAMCFAYAKISPCLFIKHDRKETLIIIIYMDDVNLFGSSRSMLETKKLLLNTFKVRDTGQMMFSQCLQFDHLPQGIFVLIYFHK
jgi:hypothetical protein